MTRARTRCLFMLGALALSNAFVFPALGGARRCASVRTRFRGPTPTTNPVAKGGEVARALAGYALTAVASPGSRGGRGRRLSMSMSTPHVWLAAATSPPGDAYLSTGLFGIAAAAIAVGTGYLVLSTVSGENGLGTFLGKEKGQNPFYDDNFSQVAPKPPDFFNKIRLPEMDYVEVYNQPPREEGLKDNGSRDPSVDTMEGGAQESNVVATAESLRLRLLEAVKSKDYALASTLEGELASFMRENGISFDDDNK